MRDAAQSRNLQFVTQYGVDLKIRGKSRSLRCTRGQADRTMTFCSILQHNNCLSSLGQTSQARNSLILSGPDQPGQKFCYPLWARPARKEFMLSSLGQTSQDRISVILSGPDQKLCHPDRPVSTFATIE